MTITSLEQQYQQNQHALDRTLEVAVRLRSALERVEAKIITHLKQERRLKHQLDEQATKRGNLIFLKSEQKSQTEEE